MIGRLDREARDVLDAFIRQAALAMERARLTDEARAAALRARAEEMRSSLLGREDDKVAALDAGADDYLTKPFGVNELLARMRVALRHAQGAAPLAASPILEFGPLRLDLARREVHVDGREVHLTPIEYKLLVLLARHADKVLTHRQILREVWGPGRESQTHYVRVHMAELRKKIEANPARPVLLITEPGVGYRLRDRPAGSPYFAR